MDGFGLQGDDSKKNAKAQRGRKRAAPEGKSSVKLPVQSMHVKRGGWNLVTTRKDYKAMPSLGGRLPGSASAEKSRKRFQTKRGGRVSIREFVKTPHEIGAGIKKDRHR